MVCVKVFPNHSISRKQDAPLGMIRWMHNKHRNRLTQSTVGKVVRDNVNLVLKKVIMERHKNVVSWDSQLWFLGTVVLCRKRKFGVETTKLCHLFSQWAPDINK